VKVVLRCVVLLGLALCLVAAPTMPASPHGVGDEGNQGCQCHAEDPSLNVQLTGLPEAYSMNTTYNLTLLMEGDVPIQENRSQGGFRMVVTNGTLHFNDTEAQEMDRGWTHREAGTQQRSWSFQWTSPSESDSRTEFRIWANAVNGNQAQTGDGWSSLQVVVPGEDFSGELEASEGIDGLSSSERLLLGAVLVVMAGLLWAGARP